MTLSDLKELGDIFCSAKHRPVPLRQLSVLSLDAKMQNIHLSIRC